MAEPNEGWGGSPQGWDKVEGGARAAEGWDKLRELEVKILGHEREPATPAAKLQQAIERLADKVRGREPERDQGRGR